MTIYALFLCFNTGVCEMHGTAHIGPGGVITEIPYRTLAECRQAAKLSSSGRLPDKDGRTFIDGGAWWECRGKHVETWDPAR